MVKNFNTTSFDLCSITQLFDNDTKVKQVCTIQIKQERPSYDNTETTKQHKNIMAQIKDAIIEGLQQLYITRFNPESNDFFILS
jgi:arginine/lysine/ornithine decarboxylase